MTSYITCYNLGMGIQGEIAEAVRNGVALIEQEARLSQEFRGGWSEARLVIDRVAHEAAKGAKEGSPAIGLHAERDNGCTAVYLFVGQRAENPSAHLRFCADHKTRKVVSHSAPPDLLPEESWDLDKFTADEIGEMIRGLVVKGLERVALDQRKDPSAAASAKSETA